jgi:hypothetical protein
MRCGWADRFMTISGSTELHYFMAIKLVKTGFHTASTTKIRVRLKPQISRDVP